MDYRFGVTFPFEAVIAESLDWTSVTNLPTDPTQVSVLTISAESRRRPGAVPGEGSLGLDAPPVPDGDGRRGALQ